MTEGSLGQIVGERVKRYRDAAGLTQAELADRTDEVFGHGLNRVTIAKIEGGGKPTARPSDRVRADNVTLQELLILAAALEVPPVLLFVPLGEADSAPLGKLDIHPLLLLEWVCGETPLCALPDNLARGVTGFHENGTPLRLFRALRARKERVHWAKQQIDSAKGRQEQQKLAVAQARFDEALLGLDEIHELISSAGLEPGDLRKDWAERLIELIPSHEVEAE